MILFPGVWHHKNEITENIYVQGHSRSYKEKESLIISVQRQCVLVKNGQILVAICV